MSAANRPDAGSPAGSIYDLGYRHYEGRRRGRLYAAWSLYVESLRGIWGFGRPMSAKAAPFILAGLYAFLALIQLAFSAIIVQSINQGSDIRLYTYDNYFTTLSPLIVLFCVAQGPEVVCRDQRYQVLPLYLTRALGVADYALAKIAALATALFAVLMVPMIALFVGNILMNPDAFKAIGAEVPKALPAIPACALAAFGLAAISLALSSFSPRRAYSAIGLIAYLLLLPAVLTVIFRTGQEAGWDWADKIPLLGPTSGLSGAIAWFFGKPLQPPSWPLSVGGEIYVLASVVSVALFTGLLLFRYRGIRV
jgi:ABC-2 type transport system permease protein